MIIISQVVLSFLLLLSTAEAQMFKKLGKKIEKAAERGVERTVEKRVEKEASKKTDNVLDEVFDEKGKPNRPVTQKEKAPDQAASDTDTGTTTRNIRQSRDPELDFSGTIIFQDDFANTADGGFPAKMTSSTGGEVISFDGQKGFRFYPNSNVLLSTNALPENFALAFELTLDNVPASLYRTSFNVYLQDMKTLKESDPKNKYGAVGFSLWGDKNDHQIDLFNKKAAYDIKEKIPYNISANVLDKTSHWVLLKQGSRLRLFINGEKIADSPNLLEAVEVNHVNLRLTGTKKEESRLFIISNVKITAIEKDLRAQWQNGGVFSTPDIYFASGSAQIQPESAHVLQQIANILNEDREASVQIIGHTDNTGNVTSNQKLSEQRAEAVKDYLNKNFGIDNDRMLTSGRGQTQPITDNSTAEGKAQNRRVEFKRK